MHVVDKFVGKLPFAMTLSHSSYIYIYIIRVQVLNHKVSSQNHDYDS